MVRDVGGSGPQGSAFWLLVFSFPLLQVPLALPRGPQCGEAGGGVGAALPAAPGKWRIRSAQQALPFKQIQASSPCLSPVSELNSANIAFSKVFQHSG